MPDKPVCYITTCDKLPTHTILGQPVCEEHYKRLVAIHKQEE
jgi:hypothetical protein